MRVLVIEDDAATAAYMTKGLREAGHVVEVAPTGRDGLFLALNETFDAIIADRLLPDPDGLGSLRAGFLNSAAPAGARIWKMREVSRHKSVQVLSDYVRNSDLLRDNAGKDFL